MDGSVQPLDRSLFLLFLPFTFAQKRNEQKMKKEVIISNSRVNSYGFRVLTEGIDIEQYKRNPILLWMHNRPYRGTKDEVLPLGVIENLRIEGDNLIGTPVFDESDEFAMAVKAKWDAGVLRMVSAGLDVIEQSEDPSLLLAGQTRATITKSKLREVSIVDIGANDDALVLYHKGQAVELSDGGLDISFLKPVNNYLNSKKMNEIALKLGLVETATEAEIISAIELNAQKVETLEKEVETLRGSSIALAVDAAIESRRITADKRDHFVALGKNIGLDQLNQTLACITPVQKPSGLINHSSGAEAEFKKLSDVPENKLVELRENNFEEYKRLYQAEYGVEL